jgi:hypothetical protein
MISDEEVLVKGVHIQQRISTLSTLLDSQIQHQERLTLSFDVFCMLLEYTILMNKEKPNKDLLLQELILKEDLLFDTGKHQLYISVDFTLSRNSIHIY